MRVFLDANILFTAAHNPAGKAAFVIEFGGAGHFRLFTSEYAREEAFRNLSAKYQASLPVLEKLQQQITITPVDSGAPFPDTLVAKDALIFQAAASCRATHLLTGDIRHFGEFMNRPEMTFSIVVQTVAEFLAVLQSE
jgi:predicted nucleic acid-binding protein